MQLTWSGGKSPSAVTLIALGCASVLVTPAAHASPDSTLLLLAAYNVAEQDEHNPYPDENEVDDDSYRHVSVLGRVGLGGGNTGIGVRASVDGTYWLDPAFGLGGQVGALGQAAFLVDESTLFAGPLVSYRTDGQGSSWLLTLGGGYGAMRSRHSRLCLLDANDCPVDSRDAHGYVVNASAGYLHRARLLELGVSLNADYARALSALTAESPNEQLVFTLAFVIGLGG